MLEPDIWNDHTKTTTPVLAQSWGQCDAEVCFRTDQTFLGKRVARLALPLQIKLAIR